MGEAQTPYFYDFGIFEPVTKPQNRKLSEVVRSRKLSEVDGSGRKWSEVDGSRYVDVSRRRSQRLTEYNIN